MVEANPYPTPAADSEWVLKGGTGLLARVPSSPADVLDDITAAIDVIHTHLQFGPVSMEIVMDAVAMRLLEIGEAVKALSPELTVREPEIPWNNVAGMRDFLAHHYFATNPEIVQAVIDKDLPSPAEAVTRLRAILPGDGS